MKLEWNRMTDGAQRADVASGDEQAYLVIGKPGAVVLTRYCPQPGLTQTQAAAQGARNAIPIHPKAGSGAVGSDLAVARKIAQDFEDRESIFGHPAWQHKSGS